MIPSSGVPSSASVLANTMVIRSPALTSNNSEFISTINSTSYVVPRQWIRFTGVIIYIYLKGIKNNFEETIFIVINTSLKFLSMWIQLPHIEYIIKQNLGGHLNLKTLFNLLIHLPSFMTITSNFV